MDTLLFYASYIPGGLLLVALVLLALAVDRGLALAHAAGPSSRLTETLRPMLEAGDLAAALSTTAMTRGAVARVALQILRRGLSAPGHQAAAAAAALGDELSRARRRLPWVQRLAGIATLFGLLATVVGYSPNYGCAPGGPARAVILAHEMSDALMSTHAGLLLAALSLVLAASLTLVVDALDAALRRESRTLIGLLWTHRERLRLRVGDTVHRAPPRLGPATYREHASLF